MVRSCLDRRPSKYVREIYFIFHDKFYEVQMDNEIIGRGGDVLNTRKNKCGYTNMESNKHDLIFQKLTKKKRRTANSLPHAVH